MNILENINRLILESSLPTIKVLTNTGREKGIKDIIISLYKQYPKIPRFYNEIEIDAKEIPNSFNGNVTLSTRFNNPLDLLEVLVHEQMHVFVFEWINKNMHNPIYSGVDRKGEWLFPEYKDNGEQSFYNHIVVCWNTRNWLKQNLSSKDVDFIYNETFQPYPKTEELVRKDFNKIR